MARCKEEKKKKKTGDGEGISYRRAPLISGAPAARCLFGSSSLPLLPTVSLLTATVNNRVCELPAPPQALKESLTLHSHNHFRPGCLGRHLRRDSPATRCGPNQTAEQREFSGKEGRKEEEEGRTSATVTQRSQTPQRHRSETLNGTFWDDSASSHVKTTDLRGHVPAQTVAPPPSFLRKTDSKPHLG